MLFTLKYCPLEMTWISVAKYNQISIRNRIAQKLVHFHWLKPVTAKSRRILVIWISDSVIEEANHEAINHDVILPHYKMRTHVHQHNDARQRLIISGSDSRLSPANIVCNKYVIISSRRRFDVIITYLLRSLFAESHVSRETGSWTNAHWISIRSQAIHFIVQIFVQGSICANTF